MENQKILDELIIGRVEPHIYAFSTNTVPNHIKVGDTYRSVLVRLNEWKKYFPDLKKVYEESATVSSEIFFRDYSVHQYLEVELHRKRLSPDEIPAYVYYSKEFFKNTNTEDVAAAIEDIRKSYEDGADKYQFYNSATSLPEVHTYRSTGWWNPRPNQQDTIDNFKKAIAAGRTKLLMYAVMRFGKSFTSLCCAKEMAAKIVVVVSAKADVREEWKKNVQSAENFCNDYTFLSAKELSRDENAIKNTLQQEKGVVVFLTLQDLQGNEIKEKHQEIFQNQIDLLIVDETHYGARAESYGKVLRTVGYEKDIKDKYSSEDFVETSDADEQIKTLDAKVTIHLSGTPYRILMGNEFSKEDIIAFYQFSDIAHDQAKWDAENFSLPETEQKEEWKNPYYGFPQMIRFAFVPNESALTLLENLKNSGTTYAFSSLLKPQSLSKKDDGSHKLFVHEKEVLELFEAIDGSKQDENVLAFLDYDKIKDGKMCRHIVCVLPYCASCDALEELLSSHSESFKNLSEYKIINISGVDRNGQYRNTAAIKKAISDCESANQKTLTLTVNRMLTGSTVEEWDTMIFLKDTASPQEYDQAIFRLQNQYIKKYNNDSGKTINYNMKPQTLLIDFDPHRMFSMQEQKSLIYNVNTEISGNARLKERMEDELSISPIITLNKNRLKQVNASDILQEISKYSASRGIREEAMDIPVDESLFNIAEILQEIERQAEIGSKGGLQMDAHKSNDNTDLETPDDNSADTDGNSGDNGNESAQAKETYDETDLQSLQNKCKTYYSRLLFFAFLTEDHVTSVDEILLKGGFEDNNKILHNLDIDPAVLEIMRNNMNPFVLSALDYKIQNINKLSHDDSIEPIQRALTAMSKFGKLSESEVTTPIKVADSMISLIPDKCFVALDGAKTKMLDVASKMGEFAIAICKRCTELKLPEAIIKDSILAIPTSGVAYEFTRKIYKILGLNLNYIAKDFTSYDLLDIKTEAEGVDYKKIRLLLSQLKPMNIISLIDNIDEEDEHMIFSAVVGNPPYQESDGGAQASARPIYQEFVNMAKQMKPEFLSFIMPSRWYAGGRGLNDFRKSMLDDEHIVELHDILHPEEIFPDTNNRGGLCYFSWDSGFDNKENGVRVVTHKKGNKQSSISRPLRTKDIEIFIRDNSAITILDKVIAKEKMFSDYVSPLRPFGIRSYVSKGDDWHETTNGMRNPVKCIGKGHKIGYVEKELVLSHLEWIEKWKVITPRANNIGTELNDDNLNTFVEEPGTICTEAYLVIGAELNLNENSAKNLARYLKTKFARFLHSIAKASQDATSKTYRFVPVMDFSIEWTDKLLYKEFHLSQAEIDLIETSIKPM